MRNSPRSSRPAGRAASRAPETTVPNRDAVAYARESIGREIARRRRAARLSQAVVATRANIRVETLSRLENGHSTPTAKTVRAILSALDG